MIINKDMRTIQCVVCDDFHYYTHCSFDDLGKEIITYYCNIENFIEFVVKDKEIIIIRKINFTLTKTFCMFLYKNKEKKVSSDFLSNLDKNNLIDALSILHTRLISLIEFL
jgi:hypothetical protein